MIKFYRISTRLLGISAFLILLRNRHSIILTSPVSLSIISIFFGISSFFLKHSNAKTSRLHPLVDSRRQIVYDSE